MNGVLRMYRRLDEIRSFFESTNTYIGLKHTNDPDYIFWLFEFVAAIGSTRSVYNLRY